MSQTWFLVSKPYQSWHELTRSIRKQVHTGYYVQNLAHLKYISRIDFRLLRNIAIYIFWFVNGNPWNFDILTHNPNNWHVFKRIWWWHFSLWRFRGFTRVWLHFYLIVFDEESIRLILILGIWYCNDRQHSSADKNIRYWQFKNIFTKTYCNLKMWNN